MKDKLNRFIDNLNGQFVECIELALSVCYDTSICQRGLKDFKKEIKRGKTGSHDPTTVGKIIQTLEENTLQKKSKLLARKLAEVQITKTGKGTRLVDQHFTTILKDIFQNRSCATDAIKRNFLISQTTANTQEIFRGGSGFVEVAMPKRTNLLNI